MAEKPNVLARELFVPGVFLLASLMALSYFLFGQTASWQVEMEVLVLTIVFAVLAFVSLYPLGKIWEMRQQRWMEQKAQQERNILQHNDQQLQELRSELEENYKVEKYKTLLAMVKEFNALEPKKKEGKSDNDNDYQAF